MMWLSVFKIECHQSHKTNRHIAGTRSTCYIFTFNETVDINLMTSFSYLLLSMMVLALAAEQTLWILIVSASIDYIFFLMEKFNYCLRFCGLSHWPLPVCLPIHSILFWLNIIKSFVVVLFTYILSWFSSIPRISFIFFLLSLGYSPFTVTIIKMLTLLYQSTITLELLTYNNNLSLFLDKHHRPRGIKVYFFSFLSAEMFECITIQGIQNT